MMDMVYRLRQKDYTTIGYGSFGAVLSTPRSPEVVVKIIDDHLGQRDAWVLWALFAIENPNLPGVPRIYRLKVTKKRIVAVMEYLEPLEDVYIDTDEGFDHVENACHGAGCPEAYSTLCLFKDWLSSHVDDVRQTIYWDTHEGNFMQCQKTGKVYVTDPIVFHYGTEKTSSKVLKSLSGTRRRAAA